MNKKIDPVADKEMVKNAVGGEEEYDALAEPPNVEKSDHPLSQQCVRALQEVFDPEIPVNIYELGLIYKITVSDSSDEEAKAQGKSDVFVEMTLTSPGCPVAQEMPGWVQGAIMPLDGVHHVDVDVIWDPPWDPSMMAETAKLQLNMFT